MTHTHTSTWLALTVPAILCAAAAPARAQSTFVVSDRSDNKVVRFEWPSGRPVDHFVGSGISPLTTPLFMVVGPDGGLYVQSVDTDSVNLYDGRTGQFKRVFVQPGSGGLDSPRGLAFDAVGNLCVASHDTSSVLRYDGQTGLFLGVFVAPGVGGLAVPNGLAFGPDGNLYVANVGTDSVLRYDGRTGAFIDVVVQPGAAGLVEVNNVLVAPDGSLYVGAGISGIIVVVPPGGSPRVLVPSISNPGQMVLAPDGQTLVVATVGLQSVREFDKDTGEFLGTLVAPGGGGLGDVIGIQFLRDPCPADLNDDGRLDVIDFFQFIVFFAAGCP